MIFDVAVGDFIADLFIEPVAGSRLLLIALEEIKRTDRWLFHRNLLGDKS